MIRTDAGFGCFTSAHAGQRDARHETVEDVHRVERPGRALGVVLDGLDRLRRVAQALDRTVVQVALADDEAALRGQRVADDLDLVVLRRDLDAARSRRRAPDGSRRGGRSAGGACSRPAARPTIWWPRQIPSSGRPSSIAACARRTGPSSRAGSPGPGERTSRATSGASASRASAVCGRTRTRAPRATSWRTMFVLEAVVDDRDQRPVRRSDLVRVVGRYLADEVLVLPAGDRAGRVDGRGRVHLARRADQDALRAGLAQPARQRACVEAGDGGHARGPAAARPAGAPARARRPWRDRRSGRAATAGALDRRHAMRP